MAAASDVARYTETHVDRFAHDPRRLLDVHQRLLAKSRGSNGIRVAADFTHYVHQIGNSHFPQRPAISAAS